MISRLTLLLSLALIACSTHAQSGPLQEVLDRLVQSYGGAENLRKLECMVQEWDFFAPMRNQHGSDVRSVRLPGQLRVELTYPDKQEIRVLNGDRAQVIFGDSAPRFARAAQMDAMRLQLMRLYSPLSLLDRMEALSLTDSGGMLALSLQEQGLRADYLVNREEWRIEKVVGTLKINGNEMRFLTEYSDFAMVEGVLVHRQENKYAGNVNTAKLQLRRITLDAGLDDGLFEVDAVAGF